MKASNPYGPEIHIRVGNSEPWRPNLVRVAEQWREGRLVPWLGAGVSMPYGLPNWNDLVLSLLLRQPPEDGRRGAGPDWARYYPHYRRALGIWMIEHFRFDPVKLARVFRDGPAFWEQLREELYAPLASAPAAPRRTSLDAVVDLIVAAKDARKPVPAVITLNFDDLLEEKLEAAGVPCTSVFSAKPAPKGKLPVYHVHGFLPRKERGKIPAQDLVFTESAYHHVSSSMFHWSLKAIMRHLQTHSVLFVGVSLIDPNLRRFLDACHQDGEDARHFAVREDYLVAEDDVPEVVQKITSKAEGYAKELGRSETKGRDQLREALTDVCKKAHDYDRKALKSLGVRPIWVSSRDDITAVLDVVHRGVPDA